MKYLVLIVLLFTTGCSQLDKTWQVDDFLVTVKTLNKTAFQANTEIELITGITNLSGDQVKILHGAPLIHVQILDQHNKTQIDNFLTLTIGISHTIKPYEFYSESIIHNKKNEVITINNPGKYTLIGTATFSIEQDGEQKQFKILSEPYEIVVDN